MNRASKCSTQQYTVVPTAKAGSGILVMTTGFRIPLTNDILIHLTAHERAALLDGGERMVLPAGETFAAADEVVSTAYFPDSGVLSYISTMATGHQLAVAAIGPDGLIGAGQLLGIVHHPYRIVALLDSEGYQIPSQALRRAFDVSRMCVRPCWRTSAGSSSRLRAWSPARACIRIASASRAGCY